MTGGAAEMRRRADRFIHVNGVADGRAGGRRWPAEVDPQRKTTRERAPIKAVARSMLSWPPTLTRYTPAGKVPMSSSPGQASSERLEQSETTQLPVLTVTP